MSSRALSKGKEESRPFSDPGSNARLSAMGVDLATHRRRTSEVAARHRAAAGVRARRPDDIAAPRGPLDDTRFQDRGGYGKIPLPAASRADFGWVPAARVPDS